MQIEIFLKMLLWLMESMRSVIACYQAWNQLEIILADQNNVHFHVLETAEEESSFPQYKVW